MMMMMMDDDDEECHCDECKSIYNRYKSTHVYIYIYMCVCDDDDDAINRYNSI